MLTALPARVARLRSQLPPAPDVGVHAREVVLIGSSSRGGSSIFSELLRRSDRLLHLPGEVNHLLRLHGLVHEASDALTAADPVPADLPRALGEEVGNPTTRLDGPDDVATFAARVAIRLTIQWPTLEFDLDTVHAAVADTLNDLEAGEGWPKGAFLDAQAFHARLLGRLRPRWPDIHPAAYDLDRRRLEAYCPGPWPDPFLPAAVVEEPPFVLITPWKVADAEALATRPLVIKTPANAYRLPWLQRLFPLARLRVLHLTRNVAASVNGLVDGWRHPGFHAHPAKLTIRGYSDVTPGGDRWWKFDRPPGWQAWTSAPLEEVCAFQWRSAHTALLAAHPGLQLAFEDVFGAPPRQEAALTRLSAWLGVPLRAELGAVLSGGLPLVMATEQPRRRRWFARIDTLAPLLADPTTLHLMERLGYGHDPATWD